jgi:hypothetical protein
MAVGKGSKDRELRRKQVEGTIKSAGRESTKIGRATAFIKELTEGTPVYGKELKTPAPEGQTKFYGKGYRKGELGKQTTYYKLMRKKYLKLKKAKKVKESYNDWIKKHPYKRPKD